jgi:hypothetical protein
MRRATADSLRSIEDEPLLHRIGAVYEANYCAYATAANP